MTDRDNQDDLDATAQLDYSDTLNDRDVPDPLDEGYSPPERPWAVEDWGTTAGEEAGHEDLDHRLARELPEVGVDDEGDDIGDASDTDGEAYDDQVGETRAGRLVAEDEGGVRDDDPDAWASDIGIDGAGASAEEAAVHVVDDDE